MKTTQFTKTTKSIKTKTSDDMLKKVRLLLSILPLLVFSTLLLFSFKSRNTMIWLWAETSYYILLALCIIWSIQLSRYLTYLNFSLKNFLATYWPGISLALVVTGLVFATVPVHFKILGDETNLLSVSQSMYYHKNSYITSMAKFHDDYLHIIDVEVPNRPLLFPFVIGMIHSVLGYHYWNVFVLNFLIMFILLAGVYVIIKKATDTSSALAGLFLILACPVFSIYGTSGGYDLFSTFYFALVMVVFYHFLKSPNSESFAFLWISLLLFSNIRYESCIFFLIIVLAAARFIKLNHLKTYAYIYVLTPLLSLPYIWQRLLCQGTYENPENVSLFSVQRFFEHGKIFIRNYLNLDLDLPYAGVLNLAAILIIGYCLRQIVTKKMVLKSYQKYFGCILLLCISLMLIIVLSHHFGRYDRPTQARLFMYFSVFCALTPIFLKTLQPNWISGRKLMAASVVIFLFYHPIASGHSFVNRLVITRIHQHSQAFLKNLEDRNALIITAYTGHFTALNYGAVTFDYANSHQEDLLAELKTHRCANIFVLQEIDYATNAPKWGNQRLDPFFKLKTIKEIQVLSDRFLRISKILL